jgi:hypothetical protein
MSAPVVLRRKGSRPSESNNFLPMSLRFATVTTLNNIGEQYIFCNTPVLKVAPEPLSQRAVSVPEVTTINVT